MMFANTMPAPHDSFQSMAMVLFNKDILKFSRDGDDNYCVVSVAVGDDC